MGQDETRTITRPLPVPLNDAAKIALGKTLADVGMEVEDHNAKIREINAVKRPLVKKALELTKQLSKGERIEDVRCTWVETGDNRVIVTRDDTGSEIENRVMTAQERQGQWDWAGATQKKVEAEQAKAKGRKPKAEPAETVDEEIASARKGAAMDRAERKANRRKEKASFPPKLGDAAPKLRALAGGKPSKIPTKRKR